MVKASFRMVRKTFLKEFGKMANSMAMGIYSAREIKVLANSLMAKEMEWESTNFQMDNDTKENSKTI